MVRASLPAVGVAAALLIASVAVGQTPQFSADPPVHYFTPAWPETTWQSESEWHHPLLDMMGETQLVSFEVVADEEKPRLKPAPQQTKEPAVACPEEVVEEVEEFGCFNCVPFFLPPPPPQQPCSGHKCRRKQKHSQCGSNQGGYGQGYGYPNQGGYGQGFGYPNNGWGYGMAGCCGGFCPSPYPPPQQDCSKHKCHRKQGSCQGGSCPRCGYPGYGGGYPGYGGGAGSPGYGYGYPVAGWSMMDDGLNSFTDPNCLGGKQGCCHGRCRKCHKQQQQAPPPYPYWPMMQPCCGMMGGYDPF